MARYAIGDIHGCWDTLTALLSDIGWSPAVDELYLVGDLVNRGPKSAEVLRWARKHEDTVHVVLGNHDLSLLCYADGLRRLQTGTRLEPLLTAEDSVELIDWLARQPLLRVLEKEVIVHAGVLPEWDPSRALSYAEEASRALRNDRLEALLGFHQQRQEPSPWSNALTGSERIGVLLSVFTCLRVCQPSGQMLPEFTAGLDAVPTGCHPWFDLRPSDEDARFVFGHWAALGVHRARTAQCIDGGCVWGGRLAALDLDTADLTTVPRVED